MFKLIVVIALAVVCVSAKPKPLITPVVAAAPLVAAAPAVVTATSSQVFARNYNGFAAPLVAAPFHAAYRTPVAAAYTSPLAYSAPLNAAYYTSPYAAAYSAPLVLA